MSSASMRTDLIQSNPIRSDPMRISSLLRLFEQEEVYERTKGEVKFVSAKLIFTLSSLSQALLKLLSSSGAEYTQIDRKAAEQTDTAKESK